MEQIQVEAFIRNQSGKGAAAEPCAGQDRFPLFFMALKPSQFPYSPAKWIWKRYSRSIPVKISSFRYN